MERIHWIDIAKGILILLVVVHHFTAATSVLGIENTPFHFVFCWTIVFTSFFMQAFFFMSGYCSNFTKPCSTFLYDITKSLIVPFFCFEFYSCAFYTNSLSWNVIFSYWVEIGGTHLWFLNALIVSKIVIYLLLRFSKSKIMMVLLTFFFYIVAVFLKEYEIGPDFLCFKASLGSVFFVALGYVCKNEKLLEKLRVFGWLFPYILLFLILFHINVPSFMGSMRITLRTLPLNAIISILGTMALINFCKGISENSILEFFGRNSLAVYCFHFTPLLFILDFFYKALSPVEIYERVVMIVLVYALEIFALILLIQIFKYRPFSWMLGKF